MRIVFAALGSLGDLYPMLALATASRERGHTPVIAAPVMYADYIKSLGMEFFAIRPNFPAEVLRELFSDPRHGSDTLMSHLIFPEAHNTYEDLLEAAKGADFLIAGELVYVAPMVGQKLNIPWGNSLLSPISLFSAYDPCLMSSAPHVYALRHLGPWPTRAIFALARRKTSQWAAPLFALQKQLGLNAGVNPILEGKYSPHLVLIQFPEFFAKPQRDWPQAVVQTSFPYFGQPADVETAQKIQDFVSAGEPPIVFTLGSTAVYLAHDFYQIAADVAMELGERAILLIAKNAPPEAPADRILSIGYAPLDVAVKGAKAVVHHGGIGCCAEVLRAGVPALVIPFGADQPDNAARLGRLGTAMTLKRNDISRPALAAKLRALLADTAMSRKVGNQINPPVSIAKSVEAMEQAAAKFGRS
jgi:rhamnosyltransferase subunit B